MIKLGKLTDYAIVVLAQLSREGAGVSRSANQISRQTGLPEPTVAKVLKQLARQKIIESVRGAAGGYRLVKPAQELSVCDIVEAMDGPIAIVSCLETSCAASSQCPSHGKWSPVNAAIRRALQDVKLADMGGAAAPHTPLIQLTGVRHAHIK